MNNPNEQQPHFDKELLAKQGFNLSAIAVRERSVTLFFIILVIGVGLLAYLKLGRAEDPKFTVKVFTVVAAWPGESRHVVAICSAPSGRWEALSPVLGDSFDTMKVEPVSSLRPPQRLLWAFAALVAALLLISIGVWRRRQAARNQP